MKVQLLHWKSVSSTDSVVSSVGSFVEGGGGVFFLACKDFGRMVDN